jgi:hypothetical protein
MALPAAAMAGLIVAGCTGGKSTAGNPVGPSAPGSPPPSIAPTQAPSAPVGTIRELALSIRLADSSSGNATFEVTDAQGKPVQTDLWLYLRAPGDAGFRPFEAFREPTGNRRVRSFLLPSSVLGRATGFAPADEGLNNGIQTDPAVRDQIDGQVEVTFTSPLASGSTLWVKAALEDQRYHGGAAFRWPDGVAVDPPESSTASEYPRRTYEADIRPWMERNGCLSCHGATDPDRKNLPVASYADLVTKSVFYNPIEYLVEPGNPALSPLIRRSRPGVDSRMSSWIGYGNRRWRISPDLEVLGDRRMPPQQDVTGETSNSLGKPISLDEHPEEFKLLYDWVAQGAPER